VGVWLRRGAILGGVLALFLPGWVEFEGLSPEGHRALGIFLMGALFWILEPVPVYATSLLVILSQVLLLSDGGFFSAGGLLGPAGGSTVAAPPALEDYRRFFATLASPIIILFLGGFSLASAAVKYGLDKSLTRWLLRPFGSRPARLCLGLMLATALLSAFMSNTATTAMMMTIAIPIGARLSPEDPFRKAVVLCIPFAANIGGIATPIGTPPNAIALAALNGLGVRVSFTTWMMLAAPLALAMLLVTWRWLLRLYPPAADEIDLRVSGGFRSSRPANIAAVVFGLTVLLWITEKLHRIPAPIIAFLPIALLPALGALGKEDIRGFSWEVLWLVAGGISLGISLESTGLTRWMLGQVNVAGLGATGALLAFAVLGFAIANLVSNTVTASILVPLVVGFGATVASTGFPQQTAVLLVSIVVSFSMMLPISTPPNAIAMSTGAIETSDMARAGVGIGLAGCVLAVLCALFFWPMLLR
jgi:sodium-dependent dicarboxylate transporter 2/3/5